MDRLESLMTDQTVCKFISLSNGLGDTDEGLIFPGQCQSKGKKEKKEFYVLLNNEVLIQHLGC